MDSFNNDMAIIINFTILALNFFLSIAFWLHNKKSTLYKSYFLIWFGQLITNLIQYAVNDYPLLISATFCTLIIVNNALGKIMFNITSLEGYKEKTYYQLAIGSSVFSLVLGSLSANFTLYSLPVVLAISSPILHYFYKIAKQQNLMLSAPAKILVVVLALNTVHNTGFSFVRLTPEMEVTGFAIGTFIYLIYSITIPIAIYEKTQSDLQNHLKGQNRSLEKLVKKRTHELHKMERWSKNLLRTVCHDLSNPISILLFSNHCIKEEVHSLLELAQDQTKNKKIKKHLAKCETALDVVSQVLNFARTLEASKSGKIGVSIKSHDLSEISREAVCNFEHRIKQKSILLELEFDRDQIQISVSKPIFSNIVLANLISNAIKFTPKNGKITLKTGICSQGRGYVEIKDTGVGIPPELLAIVFDENASTSRHGTDGEEGTGFGMPLVKHFVETMGGSIEIESVEKQTEQKNSLQHGTTVRIHFALANPAKSETEALQATERSEADSFQKSA